MTETIVIKAKIREEFPLTDNERYIIETLRSLAPFECLEITADQTGRINNFLVKRSKKVILTDNGPIYTV